MDRVRSHPSLPETVVGPCRIWPNAPSGRNETKLENYQANDPSDGWLKCFARPTDACRSLWVQSLGALDAKAELQGDFELLLAKTAR